MLHGQSDSEHATVEWLDGYAKGREDGRIEIADAILVAWAALLKAHRSRGTTEQVEPSDQPSLTEEHVRLMRILTDLKERSE